MSAAVSTEDPAAKQEQTKLQNAAYNAAWSRIREKHREEYDSYIDEEFEKRGLTRRRRATGEQRAQRLEQEKRERAERAFDKLLEDNPELLNYAREKVVS